MTGPWEIEETNDVAMWLAQLTANQWNDWYRSAIPRADDLYDEHLRRHGHGD